MSDDNIIQFPSKDIVFTDGIEEYNVDEYINILVENLEDIQCVMLDILEHPQGLSNKSKVASLVAELTNVIDGYREDV